MDRGKAERILNFVSGFTAEHGYGPTIREIGAAVGIKSPSTVSDYLVRMTRDGLITSTPGISRSIRVIEQKPRMEPCEDGSSLLCCKFRFPVGGYLMNVVAMVADSDNRTIIPVKAECVEMLRSGDASVAGIE